jgi:RNA-directed DNA polymerase
MPMERRGRQKLNRDQSSQAGLRADQPGSTSKFDFKLELQTNAWLRIGLTAKVLETKFNNLFCHITVTHLREAFHAMDGSKASGVDGMTKADYARNLEGNLVELVNRLHRGTYRPQPKRGTWIPKANGEKRPLAISSFEDKLVEWLIAKLLSTIYEPLFIRHSFGFRPRKGAQDALKVAYCSLKDDKRPCVVEIDLRRFFDTVPHRRLMKLLRLRITDRRFRSLIARFLQAGILGEAGDLAQSDSGTPQGAIMSPVLANVYLHYALDEWFLKNYASKRAVIVRYADDAIFLFEKQNEAYAFQEALKVRLAQYQLSLNEDKSGVIQFGKNQGKTFQFLGFSFYWGKDAVSSKRRLRVKTEKKRLHKKIQEFTDWVKTVRSRLTLNRIWELAAAKLRGHYQYYGVYTNRSKLSYYYFAVVGSLFKWLNRRSQRKSFTWKRFQLRLRFNPLPLPPPAARLKPLLERPNYAM